MATDIAARGRSSVMHLALPAGTRSTRDWGVDGNRRRKREIKKRLGKKTSRADLMRIDQSRAMAMAMVVVEERRNDMLHHSYW